MSFSKRYLVRFGPAFFLTAIVGLVIALGHGPAIANVASEAIFGTELDSATPTWLTAVGYLLLALGVGGFLGSAYADYLVPRAAVLGHRLAKEEVS